MSWNPFFIYGQSPDHAELEEKLQELKQEYNSKLGTDFRPHSHHWQVMRETRTSPTESSTTEVDGEKVCNFMTTWGDGCFEVHRDLGNSGELVQIRIELAVV
jgi:hypothetical protein